MPKAITAKQKEQFAVLMGLAASGDYPEIAIAMEDAGCVFIHNEVRQKTLLEFFPQITRATLGQYEERSATEGQPFTNGKAGREKRYSLKGFCEWFYARFARSGVLPDLEVDDDDPTPKSVYQKRLVKAKAEKTELENEQSRDRLIDKGESFAVINLDHYVSSIAILALVPTFMSLVESVSPRMKKRDKDKLVTGLRNEVEAICRRNLRGEVAIPDGAEELFAQLQERILGQYNGKSSPPASPSTRKPRKAGKSSRKATRRNGSKKT